MNDKRRPGKPSAFFYSPVGRSTRRATKHNSMGHKCGNLLKHFISFPKTCNRHLHHHTLALPVAIVSFRPERVLFSVALLSCLFSVPMYASEQTLDFLARRKNLRFPNRKQTVSHPAFPMKTSYKAPSRYQSGTPQTFRRNSTISSPG